MTDITNKIQSIKNMKEDLISIKLNAQKDTEKMLQDMANFRNLLCGEMFQIENNYRSGNKYRKRNKKSSTESRTKTASKVNSECKVTSQYEDANLELSQNNCFINENVRKKSKKMIIELEDSSETSGLSQIEAISQPSNKKVYPSTDILHEARGFSCTPDLDGVNVIFSNQTSYDASLSGSNQTFDQTSNIMSSSYDSMRQIISLPKNHNDSDGMTKDKIDSLTKKLKDIQKQNDELRNVNENIQNLLLKLNDLNYVNDEPLDDVDNKSQVSDLVSLCKSYSRTISARELMNYENSLQSVDFPVKNPRKMLTKIKIAKLIIKRIHHKHADDEERKYKVHVRQAQQDITLKAHHNKSQK